MSSFGRDEGSGQDRRQPARSEDEQQQQQQAQQQPAQQQQTTQRPRQSQTPAVQQQEHAPVGFGAALHIGSQREHPQLPPSHLDLVQQQQRQQEQQLASLQQLRHTPGFGQFQNPMNPYSQFASNFLYPGLNPLLNPAAGPTPAAAAAAAAAANPGNPTFDYQRQLQQQYGQLNQQQLSHVLARFQESTPVNQQVALALLQQEVANRQHQQQEEQQQERQRMAALRYQQFMQAYGHPEQTMAQRFGLTPEEMASLSGALSSFAEQDRQRKDATKQAAAGAAPARRSDSRTVEGSAKGPSEPSRHSRSISAAALESQKQTTKDGEPTRRRGQSRSIKNSGSQSSNYRGVTFHRRTGRWEAHLWDGGKQMYLGGFDSEAKAATAYDFMALKCRGEDACLNFGLEEYKEDLAWIKKVSREELIQSLRRHSKGFTRGSSKYRGVSLNPNGKWEARCSEGKQKYSYLGLFDTEEAAAAAYDRVCVRRNGKSAVTNFDIANYPKELSDHYAHKSLLEASRADTGRALGLAASEANVTTGSPTPTPRTNQDDSPSAVTQRDPIEESKPPEGDQGSKVDKGEGPKSRIDGVKKEEKELEPDSEERSRDAEGEQRSGVANEREDAKRKVPDEESPDGNDEDRKGGKRQKEG